MRHQYPDALRVDRGEPHIFTPVDPVSSLPLPDEAYGEVARRVIVVDALPLFLMDRLVTATLLSVMNLVAVASTASLL